MSASIDAAANPVHLARLTRQPIDTDTITLLIRVAIAYPEAAEILLSRSLRTHLDRRLAVAEIIATLERKEAAA